MVIRKLIGFAALIAVASFAGLKTPIGKSPEPRAEKPRDPNKIDDLKLVRALGASIRASGFNCPEAKLAYREGEDAIGHVTKVYCGPKGTDGVNTNQIFRFTMQDNGRIFVKVSSVWD
jgi:hypothetical protein